MKKKTTLFYLAIVLLFAGAFSSCDKDEDNVEPAGEYAIENNWIYDNMKEVYYWNKEISNDPVPESMYPEDYFYSLVYGKEDKWSFITDDYSGLIASLTGEPLSMGYSPAFGQISGTNKVFMIVEYVYPNSPAYRAGLRRGNIVMKINDYQLDMNNYVDLFYAPNQKLTLGHITSNGLEYSDTELSMTAEVISVNPVVYYEIIESNGVKIGYCVITEFIDDDAFSQHVGEALKNFKTAGIDELVIDLRYNGGGYMTSAQWLSSAIAPTSVIANKDLLTNIDYNNMLNLVFPTEEKEIRFMENDVNLNLNKVYFLCANGTASASELVMIGLMPYMSTIFIGENTYGKYTGSWVIPDTERVPRHNWAMMPIVLKYSNANGYTEFKNGLTPDYFIEDDIMYALPFGDVNDPLLAKAIQLCGGVVAKSDTKKQEYAFSYKRIYTKEQKNKRNLFINPKNSLRGCKSGCKVLS